MLIHGRACGSCGLLVICAGNRSVIPGLGAKVDAEAEATAAAAAAAEMTMTIALTMTMAMINTRSAKVPRGSSMMVTRPRSRQGPSGGAEPTESDMARRGRGRGHWHWHCVNRRDSMSINQCSHPVNQSAPRFGKERRWGEVSTQGLGRTGGDRGGGLEGASDRVVAWAGPGRQWID